MEGKEVPYESETRRVLKVLKEAAENDLYSDWPRKSQRSRAT